MGRRRLGLLPIALLTISCVAPADVAIPSPTPSRAPAAGASQSSEPAPPPAAETAPPLVISAQSLTCGTDGHTFPADAIGAGFAELGLDPAAAALRDLADDPGTMLPQTGWSRVYETGTTVLFVARGTTEPWAQVQLTQGPTGWTPEIYGQCHLRPVVPEGVTLADWWLDPGKPFDRDGTIVDVLLVEQSCASGQPPVGRVLDPLIVENDQAVGVAILIVDEPGDCPSNPEFAWSFEIPTPLGDRQLFDIGIFPPERVDQ